MPVETLGGIFPENFSEINALLTNIELSRKRNRSGPDKPDIVLLARELVIRGNLKIREIRQSIADDEQIAECNKTEEFLERVTPAAAVVLVGCAIECVDKTIWDGAFSAENFIRICNLGLSCTSLYYQQNPAVNLRETEHLRPGVLENLTSAAIADRTLTTALRHPEILPPFLSQLLYNTEQSRFCLELVLKEYQPIARTVLATQPIRITKERKN